MSAPMSHLQRAIHICGGQAKLGARIGVTQSRVSQWANGEFIPVRYWPLIARATVGQVTAADILEDELAKVEQLKEQEVA